MKKFGNELLIKRCFHYYLRRLNFEEHEQRKLDISEIQKRIENKILIDTGNDTDLKESRNVDKNVHKNLVPKWIEVL